MTKRFLSVLLILCVISITAFADDDLAVSKTSAATATLFGEEQDDYLDVIGYANITKNLLFVSLDSPGAGGDAVTDFEIGAANRFGGIYVAERLVLDQMGSQSLDGVGESEDSTINLIYNPVDGVTGRTITTNREVFTQNVYNDELNVLIGVANMGIGLDVTYIDSSRTVTYGVNNGIVSPDDIVTGTAFSSLLPLTYEEFDNTAADNSTFNRIDIWDGRSTINRIVTEDAAGNLVYEIYNGVDEGTLNNSDIGIGLRFGMPLALGSFDAEVKAGIDVNMINKSSAFGETSYTRDVGTAEYVTYEGVENAVSYFRQERGMTNEYMTLSPNVYFGVSMPVPVLGGSDMTVGLSYDLETDLYTDSGIKASYFERNYTPTVTSDLELTTTVRTIDGEQTVEISNLDHSIAPSVTIKKDFSDRVKFGIKYVPTFSFESETQVSSGSMVETVVYDYAPSTGTMDYVTQSTLTSSEVTTETSTMGIDHDIYVGAQFMLTDKIRLNAGAHTSTNNAFTTTTVTKESGVLTIREMTYEDTTTIADAEVEDTYVSYYDQTFSTSEPSQQLTSEPMDLSTTYSFGFTYFYSENMKIDLLANLGNGMDDTIFDLDLWTVEFTYSY